MPPDPFRADSDKGCNIRPMSQTVWDQERNATVEWMRIELQRYRQNPGKSKSFFSHVLEKYFPDVAQSQTGCNLIHECSHLACSHFRSNKEGMPQEEWENHRKRAVYAANAMSNFHNFFREVYSAFQDASTHVDRLSDELFRLFTWYDNYEKATKAKEAKKAKNIKIGLAIGLLVILILSAVAAPIAATGAATAGAGAVAVKSIDSAVGTWAGVASGAYAGGSSIFGALSGSGLDPDYLRKKEVSFDRLWSDARDVTELLLQNITLNLMEARADGPNGKNVIDILDEGGFFLPLDHHLVEDIRKYMRKQTLATSVNVLWHMDSVNAWIVRSKPPGGQSCETDDRMFAETKVCLDDSKDWTYFVTEEPERWDNLTVRDIVASSVRWWHGTGNNENLTEATNNFLPLLNKVGEGGVSVVHLPVCNSPDGRALSSLNTEWGMNYPCSCLKRDGTLDDTSPNSETMHLLLASGLYRRQKVYDYCAKWGYCQKGGTYQMDCKDKEGKPTKDGWCSNPSFFGCKYSERRQKGYLQGWGDNEAKRRRAAYEIEGRNV
ncbi:uncharacterized protein LTHEOB_8393 [Lasiodiplodia theobromae]|uniref:uncharacterized protein n=1 Tax=Lasiodiplodia theobromae TaxID=45133 RepID=UPI0015C2C4A3|nr:uncharacterized protein LTHEOB_8393 [Lasiodiplodia theobromae]KAF4541812.1 hypothetical protein LTHEOB_8393 [Lasiodiplodia theobromae]